MGSIEMYDTATDNRPVSGQDLKDSGSRQNFTSGAVRDAEEAKGMIELIPEWSTFAYAWIMESGSKKYSARNWERGMPISRYIRSARNHLAKYMMGFRDEPHLWQAFWNIGCAIHTQILVYIGVYPKEFYDLPNHVVTGAEPEMLSEFEKIRIHKMMGWDAPPAKATK